MRIYVPGPVSLTPRERAARALHFVGLCAAMFGAGVGMIVVFTALSVAFDVTIGPR